MALEIKAELQIDVGGQIIWVLDNTGVYSANNVGGWGDPNAERNEKALMIYAKRVTDDGFLVSEIVSNQIAWAVSLLNTDVSEFQINVDQDGVYYIYLFALKVTTDGIVDLEGNTLVDGDIVVENNIVKIRQDGSLVDFTDFDVLIDNAQADQVECVDIIMSNIQIKHNKLYKTYIEKRDENCEDVSDDLREILSLKQDIAGVEYLFRSNLPIKARKALEELHNKYP